MPIPTHVTIDYLTLVAAAMRTHGYMSKSAASKKTGAVATTVLVREISGDPGKQKASGIEVTDDDRIMASDALTWAREDLAMNLPTIGNTTIPDSQSFDYRLVVAVAEDQITDRKLATAAALIQAYQRATGESSEGKAYAAQYENSRHFGELDERNIWTVSVQDVRPMNSNGRMSWLVTMLTPRGDVAKWWASSEPPIQSGTHTLVCGTIQRHDAYLDVPETILSRCTFQTGSAVTKSAVASD